MRKGDSRLQHESIAACDFLCSESARGGASGTKSHTRQSMPLTDVSLSGRLNGNNLYNSRIVMYLGANTR